MTPVVPYSISNVSVFPGTAFTSRKTNSLTKFNFTRKSARHTLSPQSFLLPFSASIRLFPLYNNRCPVPHRSTYVVSATGTDVAVEQPDSAAAEASTESDAAETVGKSSNSDVSSSPSQARRARPGRQSEMSPVKNEELVPGATFTGKVRSIQPFGAFIDFGAFTDGLVHVSQLSDTYVKDVGSVVSVGQEVKVTLVEANMETKRISLTMREGKDPSSSSDRGGSDRRGGPKKGERKNEGRKSSKFSKGQNLVGTVKNLVRAGAFISLPEGEEGFLPQSEEADEGFASMMGETSLEVGQEINVRVLRISRGQVTLTMKLEEDVQKSESQITQGVIHTATNPFLVAFRQNKDIAAFLDEREKVEKATKETSTPKSTEKSTQEVLDKQVSSDEQSLGVPASMDESTENDGAPLEVVDAGASGVDDESSLEDEETIISSSTETLETIDGVVQDLQQEEGSSKIVAPEESISTTDSTEQESPSTDGVENDANSDMSGEIVDQALPSDDTKPEDVIESKVDDTIAKDEPQLEPPTWESESPSTPLSEDEEVQPAPDTSGSITSPDVQPDLASPQETKATISPALVKQLRDESGAGMMDCKKALSECGGDIVKAQEFLRKKGLASADKKASRVTAEGRIGSYIHDSRIGILLEVNCETDFVSRGDIFKELVEDLAMQTAACPQVQYVTTEDVPEEFVKKEREIEMQKEDLMSKPEQIRSKIVDGRIKKRLDELALLEQPYIKNDKVVVKDWVKQTIATIGENIKVKRFVRFNLGEGLEKRSQDFAAEVAAQTAAKKVPAAGKEQPAAVETKEPVQKAPTVAVSAALVKQLRDETGAGMMDCKKALAETGGDIEKAQEYLRKKGLSSAEKKSSRLAAEGRIGSYIHDARIGVLIEVNCETDFVGRSGKFKELVDDLAMQVVACPQVQFVSIEDIPESTVKKEKEIEMQREDLLLKPENIREKIVEGRISKRLGELALLEQPFIKDDNILVKDLVKQTVAALGENIKVRRFVRFTLGETVEGIKSEA
ncbi:polyprotein of EF-Ts, chloroplastic [Argentina anserina]|uniref:polyprotein of EF-Ts, chloroplastic n=1 Tax=Argentina anserina TaxID=57926 RepID=UPI0021765B46|nr:polyprotein of EF-Ts, chloroplastic [Potentilla anserina]